MPASTVTFGPAGSSATILSRFLRESNFVDVSAIELKQWRVPNTLNSWVSFTNRLASSTVSGTYNRRVPYSRFPAQFLSSLRPCRAMRGDSIRPATNAEHSLMNVLLFNFWPPVKLEWATLALRVDLHVLNLRWQPHLNSSQPKMDPVTPTWTLTVTDRRLRWLQKQHPGACGHKLQMWASGAFQGSLTPDADRNASSTENPDVRAFFRAHPAAIFSVCAVLRLGEQSRYRSNNTPISSSPQTLTYCACPIVPGPFGPIS